MNDNNIRKKLTNLSYPKKIMCFARKILQAKALLRLSIMPLLLCMLPSTLLAKNYDIISLLPQPLSASIKKSGTLNFQRTTKLAFHTQGYLKKLTVDAGDMVKKDQLLASLDIVKLTEQKNIAYARLRQAKSDVERAEILLSKNLSSEQEVEDRKTLVDTARAAYKIAYYDLEKAEVRAPFNGVVLSRFSELEELQTQANPLLEVAALENNLVVEISLTGQEVSDLVLGTFVDVTLHNNTRVKGQVSKIAVLADPLSHLFTVQILLPAINFNNGAISGQIAKVEINILEQGNAYQVPIEALISVDENGKAIVITESIEDIKKIHKRSFDVIKLDNHFVYLVPDNNEEIVSFLVRGWQQLDPPMYGTDEPSLVQPSPSLPAK